MRKYLDSSSMESVYFCQIGMSFVFKYNTSLKFVRPLSRGRCCKSKEAENGRPLARLHGNFTPAHACGCAAQCFEGVQRGCLIVLPMGRRLQAAIPDLRPCVFRSAVIGAYPMGLKWYHGAPAYRLLQQPIGFLPAGVDRPAGHIHVLGDLAVCHLHDQEPVHQKDVLVFLGQGVQRLGQPVVLD